MIKDSHLGTPIKRKVLVTGASGQLGQALAEQSIHFRNFEYLFLSRNDLDITIKADIASTIAQYQPDIIINTAAYTAVDAAEDDKERAYLINHKAALFLAQVCKDKNIAYIHISTDYVFDGTSITPYTEDVLPNPQTVYGASKLAGEQAIIDTYLNKFAIVRTSWVYSVYGHNFVKTMLRLGKERDSLSVVNDQLGCPTWANDLADAILVIATNLQEDNSGLYHYSNTGKATWYDFAQAIFEHTTMDVSVLPVTSDLFPTRAKRPSNSVLNTDKLATQFQINIPNWKDSLHKMLNTL